MSETEKIIFYLTFAKSKLDNNNLSHRKASKEIEKIIERLKVEEMEIANENHIPMI